jgi:hypothetical protein
MATVHTLQNWPGACLPGSRHLLQPVVPRAMLPATSISAERGIGPCLQAERRQSLCLYLRRCVLAKFRCHCWIIEQFIIINLQPNGSSCME